MSFFMNYVRARVGNSLQYQFGLKIRTIMDVKLLLALSVFDYVYIVVE